MMSQHTIFLLQIRDVHTVTALNKRLKQVGFGAGWDVVADSGIGSQSR